MTVRVVARITARPDTIPQLRSVLLALLEPTRHEPGCLRYELLQSVADPTDFTFVEEWRSQQDEREHMQTPHVQRALQQVPDLVAVPPDIRSYRVIG
jgi:quinol monooxygenase YgiN